MLRIQQEQRSRLYFGRYEYALSLHVQEACALRNLDPEKIRRSVMRRNTWAAMSGRPESPEWALQNILTMAAQLATLQDHKHTTYSNWLYVYHNELRELTTLAEMEFVKWPTIKQAQVTLPSNCVLVKSPKNRFRTYFRCRNFSETQREHLRRYLLSQRGYYRMTDLFLQTLERRVYWPREHHFVDHDDARDPVVLEMVLPGIVRCTLPIQAK